MIERVAAGPIAGAGRSLLMCVALVMGSPLDAGSSLRAQQPPRAGSVTIRYGVPVSHLGARFEQFEASGIIWTRRSAPSSRFRLRTGLAAGMLTGGSDIAYRVALGPTLETLLLGGRLRVRAGSSAALLSTHTAGGRDLGGPIQFVSHAGFELRLFHGLTAGYRIEHMSNASLYQRNPGLNMLQFEIAVGARVAGS